MQRQFRLHRANVRMRHIHTNILFGMFERALPLRLLGSWRDGNAPHLVLARINPSAPPEHATNVYWDVWVEYVPVTVHRFQKYR